MEKVRLGIIGVGNMGSSHIKNALEGKMPEIEITAVADIKPDRLEWAKEQLPEVKTFDTASALMDSGEVDAVLIATPHYDHPPLVIEALEKGLHAMSEKPAGVYVKQVKEMNKVADEHPEVIFGMMFNQRTNHVYRKMRELVQSGQYGEIRRVNWIITDWYRTQAYYNSGGWRATWAGEGGGVMLNQCPHQLDLWQWICGMPEKITAVCHEGKWHDIEVEDDVSTYVEYANGATGTFITTTGDACGSNRFEIQMAGAKLIAENDELYKRISTVTQLDDIEKAMKNAWKNAFSSIASSGMTTVIGLIMLVFMSFKIGIDLGIVLAKGVLLSIICVLTVLPALILIFDEKIEDTEKKELHIPLGLLSRFQYKASKPIAIFFVILFEVGIVGL